MTKHDEPQDDCRLLPCPFCGGEAKIRKADCGPGYQTSVVKCTRCPADVGKIGLDAETYWNARTPVPDKGLIEKLEAECSLNDASPTDLGHVVAWKQGIRDGLSAAIEIVRQYEAPLAEPAKDVVEGV